MEESISVKYPFKDPHMHLSGKYCCWLGALQHRPWIPDRAARVLGPSQSLVFRVTEVSGSPDAELYGKKSRVR